MEFIKYKTQQLILAQKSNKAQIFARFIFTSIYAILYLLFLPMMILSWWKFVSLWGVTEVNCEQIEPTIIDCEVKRTKYAGLISETKSLKNTQLISNSGHTYGFIFWVKTDSKILGDSQGNRVQLERLKQINNKLGVVPFIDPQEVLLEQTPLLKATSLTEFNNKEFLELPYSELPYSSVKIDNRLDTTLLILVGTYTLILIISTAVLIQSALSIKIKYETIFDFNKETNKFQWEKVILLGTMKKTYNLTDISDIIFEEKTNHKSDNFYSIFLQIKSFKICLMKSYSQLAPVQEKAKQISRFLDIPITTVTKN